MKRTIFLFLMACLVMAFTSCDIETSGNGDLDGYWHLTSVDSMQTGGTADVSEDRIFWRVQGDILNVTQPMKGGNYIFRFTYQDNSLDLYDARFNDRDGSDSLVTNVNELFPLGITSLTPHYNVEKLSGSKMVLSNDTLRLRFTKF